MEIHFFLDEVFVKIQGKQRYLWRAIDQDGEVVDIFLQARRDGKAAKRFFKQFLKKCRNEPRKIITDKLKSYGVATENLFPTQFTVLPNMPIIALSFHTNQLG